MANEKQKRYSRKKALADAEIGDLPAVVDPARRESCRLDAHRFLVTYFPQSTGLKPFGDMQRACIARTEEAMLKGGRFAQAEPRGGGKTTRAENLTIWGAFYGHLRFPVVMAADSGAASNILDSIKTEMSDNDLLYDDFPEICHPIRALDGQWQRCRSQTHNGHLTHVAWTADRIVLPTILDADGEPTPSSGVIMVTRGIESGARGLKHKRPDGVQQRPDFVLLDDPQNDRSASTPGQVEKRESVIKKTVLKLGGHTKPMAFVMNGTVIRRGDLVDRMMDTRLWPSLQSIRIKMVTKWAGGRPADDKDARNWQGDTDPHDQLWLGDYARLRNTYDPEVLGDQQRAHREATEFYRRNRERMDAGASTFWEHCYGETEISALQHAYNMLIDDGPEVFASECQNAPLEDKADEREQLHPDDLATKVNNVPRGVLPAGCNRLTVFVDPKKSCLFWTAVATGDHFDGAVVDYGVWPEQSKPYFTAREIKRTLMKVHASASPMEALYAGLDTLVNKLVDRSWKREDGGDFKPERILVDANWGEARDTIYQFCRQSAAGAIILPSHGKYFGARGKAFADSFQRKPGDKVGPGWRIPGGVGKRHVYFDTNYWKTFVAERWRTKMGGRGCLSIFGNRDGGNPELHRLFFDHQCAERSVKVESAGRSVNEWMLKAEKMDNDWLDCIVGAFVASSERGAALLDGGGNVVKRVRVKMSDRQKTARTWGQL